MQTFTVTGIAMVVGIGDEKFIVVTHFFVLKAAAFAVTFIVRIHEEELILLARWLVRGTAALFKTLIVRVGEQELVLFTLGPFIVQTPAFAVTFIVRIHKQKLILLARRFLRGTNTVASAAVFISNEMLTVRASGTFMFTAAHSMALIFGINFENLIVGTRWMWMVALAHAAAKINGAHEVLSMGTVRPSTSNVCRQSSSRN
jgi:hypothetical protein